MQNVSYQMLLVPPHHGVDMIIFSKHSEQGLFDVDTTASPQCVKPCAHKSPLRMLKQRPPVAYLTTIMVKYSFFSRYTNTHWCSCLHRTKRPHLFLILKQVKYRLITFQPPGYEWKGNAKKGLSTWDWSY